MRTFQEIADHAGRISTSRLDVELTFKIVQELAEAMHRLEYNLAVQLAFMKITSAHGIIDMELQKVLIDTWLGNLRREIPDEVS